MFSDYWQFKHYKLQSVDCWLLANSDADIVTANNYLVVVDGITNCNCDRNIYIYILVSTNNSNNDGCDTFTLLPLQYNNFDSIYQT